MHVCPALTNLPQAIRLAATLTLALRLTMAGLLPPNSKVTGVRCSAAARMTMRATRLLPVYRMWSKRWASSSVVSATPPSTTVTAGSSSAMISEVSSAAVAGASSLGLPTTALPAEMAATIGSSSSCTG